MNNLNTSAVLPDDDDNQSLDTLLDDALADFGKPVPPIRNEESSGPLPLSGDSSNTSAWTDEFIKQATQNFEVTMKSILEHQKISTEAADSSQTVDLGEMSAEFSKFAEIAAKAASESSTDKDFTRCLTETMQKISKNKEEAEAVPSGEELQKMFEQLGLGEMGGHPGLNSSSADGMAGFFPLMQTMLENLISKDVLYNPMKEIVTKYPDWLADNRSKLSEADFDQYNKQYGVMKMVVEKFEEEKENDTEEQRGQNFEAVLKLMQKLQDYGQPPQELVGDQTPILNFDELGNPQLPDLSSLFGAAGFPTFSSSGDPEVDLQNALSNQSRESSEQASDQCRIM